MNSAASPEMTVALVQTDLYWENVQANLASLEEKIAEIEGKFDLLLLPEMFNTGFTMDTRFAEPMNFTSTRWLRQMAQRTQALIIGSVSISEGGNFYNRIFCVFPDGSIETSDKRHLFRMGKEHENFTPGNERLMVNWKGWKISPLVCYDLRFPVWSRNIPDDPFDLLVYVANWPAARAAAWRNLLVARAIENQCYVAGVNRIGEDGHGVGHQGDSILIDFDGKVIKDLEDQNKTALGKITKAPLQEIRSSFPVLKDADSFQLD
ncbi:amidohydrolase [Dyadobacter tibetensis]|uniref:amidohydrolase n=1 Tax=Dyadobacter tibetensis TaxID=1211851 RepID=UPI000471E1E7|nr:amidohydrolase [Dyadobacter tibetensis]